MNFGGRCMWVSVDPVDIPLLIEWLFYGPRRDSEQTLHDFSAHPIRTLCRLCMASLRTKFVADVIRAPTHGGTHLDAPIHFHKGGWAVSEIPLQRLLFRPIALVDVRDKTALNSTYSLSVEDIRSWEEQHGRLPEGCLLFARTGWSKLWPNRTAYMGIDSNGTRHFPSFSNDLAKFLVQERDVYGVGLDAASVDFYGQTQTHRILGAKNIYNLENLADLQRLPEKGAHAIVLPMKIGGASGAPVRVVAILP
ncbi:isatin hydrolase [Ixodes scapularis]